MKKLLILAALCFATPLASCATVDAPPTAENTIVDEQAAIAVNVAYKAFRLAVETGINAGVVKGSLAGRLAEADQRIFNAVQAVDVAYRAAQLTPSIANVALYRARVTEAINLIGQGNDVLKSGSN